MYNEVLITTKVIFFNICGIFSCFLFEPCRVVFCEISIVLIFIIMAKRNQKILLYIPVIMDHGQM